MKTKKIVFFKVHNEIVLEESQNITLDHVEKMKWLVAEECGVQYDDIDVDFVEIFDEDYSEIDATIMGLVYWKDCYTEVITGVECSLEIGSDLYLDAINSGTLLDHIRLK